MKKAEKDEVLKILHECITHPEVDEDDEALVDYRQAKLMIMGIQEEPSFEIKHMEEKKEKKQQLDEQQVEEVNGGRVKLRGVFVEGPDVETYA